MSFSVLAFLLVAFLLPVWLDGRTLRDTANVINTAPWDRLRPTGGLTPYAIDPTPSLSIQPSEKLNRDLIRHGKGFIWNPYVGFGQPWVGAMIASPYFPFKILQWVLPYRLGSDLMLVLLLYLAGVGFYLLGISLGLTPAAALVPAVCFMFSERLMVFINMPNFQIETLLPLTLFSIHRMVLFRSVRYSILTGWLGAAQFLGGFPESSFIFGLASAGFLIMLMFQEPARRHWKVLLLLSGGAVILTLLMSGFQVAEFVRYLKFSHHFHVAKIGWRVRPHSEIINMFIPFFFGLPFADLTHEWTPLPPANHLSLSIFSGITAVILAAVGVIGRHACKGRMFFFGMFVIFAGFNYGFPVFKLVGQLPLFNVTSHPWHIWMIPFSVAMLAGYGMHTLLVGTTRVWYKVALAFAVCVIVPVLCMRSYPAIPEDAYKYLIKPGWKLIVLGMSGVSISLACMRMPRWRSLAPALILGVLFLENYYVDNKIGYSRLAFTPSNPPVVEWLTNHTQQERLLGLQAFFAADSLLNDKLRDIRHLDAMHGKLYADYTTAVWPGMDAALFMPGQPLWKTFDSKLLDIAAVRYVFAPTGSREAPPDMIDSIMEKGKITTFERRLVNGAAAFNINQDQRRVLFEHPPSSIEYPVTVPADGQLSFSLGEEPLAWSRPGDGTTFEIAVSDPAEGPVSKYTRFYDPKHNPADRRWIDGKVDLSSYAGKTVNLLFNTKPGANGAGSNTNGWDGWAGLRWNSGKFTPVYSDGTTSVFRNNDAAARATFVPFHRDASPTFNPSEMLDASFDYRREVYLWNYKLQHYGNCPASGEVKSSIAYLRDDPDVASFRADTPCDGFFVLADLYYPGWKATIDGKPARIYCANYAFRAIALPAGHHDVVFQYAPWTVTVGFPAAILGLLTSSLIMIFGWARLMEHD